MSKKTEQRNFLDIVFSRNMDLKWETDNDGIVTIFVPNRGFWNNLAQKLFHKAEVSKLTLDILGSFIWIKIDGNRDICSIGQALKENFGDSAEPLYERLTAFIRQLERNGLIERKDKHVSKS